MSKFALEKMIVSDLSSIRMSDLEQHGPEAVVLGGGYDDGL
jgi:hypothetical protein